MIFDKSYWQSLNQSYFLKDADFDKLINLHSDFYKVDYNHYWNNPIPEQLDDVFLILKWEHARNFEASQGISKDQITFRDLPMILEELQINQIPDISTDDKLALQKMQRASLRILNVPFEKAMEGLAYPDWKFKPKGGYTQSIITHVINSVKIFAKWRLLIGV
jgi:hypothetical protein